MRCARQCDSEHALTRTRLQHAAKERAALLAEKRAIFRRNDAVIRGVLGNARGSVLRAWLRMALNLTHLPRIYAVHWARCGAAAGARGARAALRCTAVALPRLVLAALLCALTYLAYWAMQD